MPFDGMDCESRDRYIRNTLLVRDILARQSDLDQSSFDSCVYHGMQIAGMVATPPHQMTLCDVAEEEVMCVLGVKPSRAIDLISSSRVKFKDEVLQRHLCDLGYLPAKRREATLRILEAALPVAIYLVVIGGAMGAALGLLS